MAGLKVWGTYYWTRPNQLNGCWDMQYAVSEIPPFIFFFILNFFIHHVRNIYRHIAKLFIIRSEWKDRRQSWEGREEKGSLLSSSLRLVSLFIIISDADILGVPKEITMIQQEVSHLSFLACWPECLNPESIRMEALYLSCFMHITGGCHWLSISPLTT